jgi:hypothetical protein
MTANIDHTGNSHMYRVRAFMRMTSVAASAPQSGYQSELFRGFSSIGNKVDEIHTGVNMIRSELTNIKINVS